MYMEWEIGCRMGALVSTSGTDSGDCSSRPCGTITYAISQASSGDTIDIAAGTYSEVNITVDKDLMLFRNSESSTIVEAHAERGQATGRVFSINSGSTVTIEYMTIRHGNTTGNGGVIYNGGNLKLTNSTVSDNNSGNDAGGIYNHNGNLKLTNNTVSDNNSIYRDCGIYNYDGNINLSNSTVSNNLSSYGEGVFIWFNNTFPVSVMTPLAAGSIITNRATICSRELISPVADE